MIALATNKMEKRESGHHNSLQTALYCSYTSKKKKKVPLASFYHEEILRYIATVY